MEHSLFLSSGVSPGLRRLLLVCSVGWLVDSDTMSVSVGSRTSRRDDSRPGGGSAAAGSGKQTDGPAAASEARGGEVPPLLPPHITNTGVVVQLRQIQYSHGFRCYRLERQSSQGENAGPDGNYRNWWDDDTKQRPLARRDVGADTALLDTSQWAVKPASARTVSARLFNMNDLFVLAVIFTIILQPLWLSRGGGDTKAGWADTGAPHHLPRNLSSWRLLVLLMVSPGIVIPLFRMFNAFTSVYIEEVVVVAGVGLQLTSYGIFNTVRSSTFVDLSMIRSLVIHDAFFRYQPIFFLSASVENQPQRLIFFPHTLPRLEVLLPVLRGVRAVLYGEPETGLSLAQMEEKQTGGGDDEIEPPHSAVADGLTRLAPPRPDMLPQPQNKQTNIYIYIYIYTAKELPLCTCITLFTDCPLFILPHFSPFLPLLSFLGAFGSGAVGFTVPCYHFIASYHWCTNWPLVRQEGTLFEVEQPSVSPPDMCRLPGAALSTGQRLLQAVPRAVRLPRGPGTVTCVTRRHFWSPSHPTLASTRPPSSSSACRSASREKGRPTRSTPPAGRSPRSASALTARLTAPSGGRKAFRPTLQPGESLPLRDNANPTVHEPGPGQGGQPSLMATRSSMKGRFNRVVAEKGFLFAAVLYLLGETMTICLALLFHWGYLGRWADIRFYLRWAFQLDETEVTAGERKAGDPAEQPADQARAEENEAWGPWILQWMERGPMLWEEHDLHLSLRLLFHYAVANSLLLPAYRYQYAFCGKLFHVLRRLRWKKSAKPTTTTTNSVHG
eukprot:gene11397-7902_t